MVKWRPEGWNPRDLWGELFGYTSSFTVDDERRVEFGADAIVTALRKMGLTVPNIRDLEHEDHESTTDDELSPAIARLDGKQGTLVLIPGAPAQEEGGR